MNGSHRLKYSIAVGVNAADAPCLPSTHEQATQCNGDHGATPCKSQKWYRTPVANKVTCDSMLERLCNSSKAANSKQCGSCTEEVANANKLSYVGCTDALIGSWCNSSATSGSGVGSGVGSPRGPRKKV